MIRRLAETPGSVLAVVFLWKVALLGFTSQPVPNNDSFFYDGPVVNYLLHGRYCNPALIHALPISGGEVFSAYPPLYQLVLLGWMTLFGPSAVAAMGLHVALLGLYFVIVQAIFRQVQVSAPMGNLAGLFLLGITFHDRPDTLAHVWGALTIWALLRGGPWVWAAAGAGVLLFCTSLQIGAVYVFWAVLIACGNAWLGRSAFPWAAGVAGGLLLLGLIALVRFGFPGLWAGFQEHVRITPSLTEWRWPGMMEILKAGRTAPALLFLAGLLAGVLICQPHRLKDALGSSAAVVAASGTLAAMALLAASLVKISPNTVHITNYLQPVVVGTFLASGASRRFGAKGEATVIGVLLVLSLITGIRAAGMTTWGVVCTRDVSRQAALTRIRGEVDVLPAGSTVIASAAYLYDLANRTNIQWVHNDWPAAPAAGANWESAAFGDLRPARIFLTQFDYYRRFGAVVEQLKMHPDLVTLTVTNLATVRPPDAYPQWQRVVQHVSWAPVIVELQWR